MFDDKVEDYFANGNRVPNAFGSQIRERRSFKEVKGDEALGERLVDQQAAEAKRAVAHAAANLGGD